MKQEQETFSIESIGILLRHPWLFLYPAVILTGVIIAYAYSATLFYQSTAVLSFEIAGGTIIDTKFIQKKTDLAGRVLLGENINSIIKKVWPDIAEKKDTIKYNGLLEGLRDPKNGINIQYDRKDQRLLNISFVNPSPDICYKVVKATVEIIQDENKRVSKKEMEAGLAFLKSQVDFYKNKLNTIDEEIANIKTELKRSFPDMTDAEKSLIQDLMNGSELERRTRQELSPIMQKSLKYEEILTELNLQLLEVEKKREFIKRRLETGAFAVQPAPAQNLEEDLFIKEYSKVIANKQLLMSELISKGYMPGHPDVKKLQREIDDLNALKQSRIDELKNQTPLLLPEDAKKIAAENAKNELEDTGFQIETLKDKIKLMEQKQSAQQSQPIEVKSDKVSKLASRMKELRNEKEINSTYYADLRKQLEAAEIKNRLQKEESGFNIDIIEPPKLPIEPMPFQRLSKMLMGLMLAIGTGAGLAYAVDSLDHSARSSSELRELLQIPILASIDKINTRQEIMTEKFQRTVRAVGLLLSFPLTYIIVKSFLAMF